MRGKINKNRTIEENEEYCGDAGMHACRLFWPFKLHNVRFKQALDHKGWWRIEQIRKSTYQNRKWEISFECKNADLSSLLSL
jgi:hypothetical protein